MLPTPALRLTIGPSPRLDVLFGAGHLGAMLIAAALLPAAAAAAAVAGVGLSWLDVRRRHVVRSSPAAITAIELGAGQVTAQARDGRQWTGRLVTSFVTPALVVLNLRPEQRWRAVPIVISVDATGPEAHRRLRVWLKWRPVPADNRKVI